MTSSPVCPNCHHPLPGGSLGALCPACMLELALTPDLEPEIPTTDLPRYFANHEILGEIARGGMGVVYRARRLELDRLVALKVVRTGSLATPDARMRFTLEVEAISKLHHPNIIQLFETGQEDDIHYFSMPLYEKGTFAEQDLPLRENITILKKATAAVRHAHERGVLHRDIKPSNILIEDEGEPILSDFGLVKQLRTDSSVTISRTIVGSPLYMAPEQEKGEVSTASDIYSLGAILHEILTGAPPERKPSLSVPDRKKPDLSAICLKCLDHIPAKRYASAATLEADLTRWLKGQAVQARQRSALESILLWCRQNRALASVLAICLLLISVLTIGATMAAIKISHAEKIATTRLQVLQRDQIESLIERGKAHESLAHLASFVREHPKDHIAKDVLISTLGHRRFPVKQMTPFRRSSSKVIASHVGQQILTLSADGALARWHKDRREPDLITSFPTPITQAYFSHDGEKVFFSHQKTLYLWHEGKLSKAFENNIPSIWSLSRTSDQIITFSKGTLQLWKIPESILLQSTEVRASGKIKTMAFSPDGKIALGSSDGEILIWAPSQKKIRSLPKNPDRHFSELSFSPDGSLIATGDLRGGIQIFHLKDDSPTSPLFRHGHQIYHLTFSADGSSLVSGAEDGFARIWVVDTGQLSDEPARTRAGVNHVHLYQDQLHTISLDGVISSFTLKDPFLKENLDRKSSIPRTYGFKNTRFTSVSETLPARRPDGQPFNLQSPLPWQALVDPSGRYLATLTRSGIATITQIDGPNQTITLDLGKSFPVSMTFSPNGNDLAIVSSDSRISFWDSEQGERSRPDHSLSGYGGITQLSYSADGSKYLISGARRASLFDTKDSSLIWERRHRDRLFSAQLSPSEDAVLVASIDGSAYLWNLDDSIPKKFPHRAPLFHATFSPDGKSILTASFSSSLRLWDRKSGRPQSGLIPISGQLTGAGFTADGTSLISTTKDGTIQLWKIKDLPEISQLPKLAELVSGLQLNADQHLSTRNHRTQHEEAQSLLKKEPSPFASWLLVPDSR